MKDKCCGNCKYFVNEDVEGWGTCKFHQVTKCDDKCGYHSFRNNGWTEITPDNEHELTDELIERTVIGWRDRGNRQHIVAFANRAIGVGTMAKYGGYYYYVLPELKIE